ARNKINAWYKKENRAENIIKGKEMLEKEIKRENPELQVLLTDEYIQKIVRRYGYGNTDDLYANIGYGGIQIANIITKLKDEYKKKNQKEQASNMLSVTATLPHTHKASSDGIVVKGVDNCLVRYSKCCNPVPGDRIVGYITRGRGVSVHRQDCVNVAAYISDPNEKMRLIDVSWAVDKSSSFDANLKLVCNDRNGLVVEVVNLINDSKILLKAVNGRAAKGNVCLIDVTVAINNADELDRLINKIRAIHDVIEVTRY
ncbi:MAG: bifunctional (p)ppGpp synthetase/guanosine-3',5'-bis(diphosphate) 3'-pyrophosphohydrolase, partial [Clostridia bacterium]|nr:bifunctional (p)ppGpp synthetase/guanosine-3',5'-bis(diphosphate) 3'-pyrophosphohydrolase [Clostridia bacterium]